ncbi:MAG: thymidine phosphorylase, partial [Chlorobiaceae bacterium]|nr:thymidine phosphorylase [Chlorobiaceae bacterium]
ASALLMSIYFQKMTDLETVYLTEAMMNSGDVIDLSTIKGIVADKHSTGGVGDKTTLVLAPMLASCGIPVAKMSGRGLGHTGGTIDKLESIKGFSADMKEEQFIKNVNEIKIAIAGQTGNLSPADKKMYALRDVTGTVDNISLIAGSIMSKKLAAGSQAILLDVKVGSGAFMKTEEDAFSLARLMVKIGTEMGRNTEAIITDMEQPLGRAVGNALEVKEAILTLNGKGPDDLYQLCITLGSELIMMTGNAETRQDAIDMLQNSVNDGRAFKKFAQFIQTQGGDINKVMDPELLPKAAYVLELKSAGTKYVKSIDALGIGNCALILGAGREKKDAAVDLSVGIYLNKKVGEKVFPDEIIATIHTNDLAKGEEALKKLSDSYCFSDEEVTKNRLIHGLVTKDGVKVY